MNNTKQIISEFIYLSLTTNSWFLHLDAPDSSSSTYLNTIISTATTKLLTKASKALLAHFKLYQPLRPHRMLVFPSFTMLLAHGAFILAFKHIKLIPFLGPLHTLTSLGGDAFAPRSLQSWLFSNITVSVQISPL